MTGLITTKALILYHVNGEPDDLEELDMNPKIISERLEVEYGYVTTLISQLEDEGLIRAEEDGRRKVLSLTPEGRNMAEAVNDMVGIASVKLDSKEVLNSKIYG